MPRIIDGGRVGRLYERAQVGRYFARSLLYAIPLYFVGVATQWFLAGYAWATVQSFLVLQAPWVAAYVFITVALVSRSPWLVRIAALALSALMVHWLYEAGQQLHRALAYDWQWVLAGSVRLVITTWLAVELAAALAPTYRGTSSELRLGGENRLLFAALGLPPSARQIALGRVGMLLLLLTSAFLFAFALLQTTGLIVSAEVLHERAIGQCGSNLADAARVACLAEFGQAELVGQLVIWPTFFVLPVALARWLQRLARRKARRSAADATKHDPRPPILFLRAFEDDQVALSHGPATLLAWIFGFIRGKPPLDHLLIEEFAAIGPTVALAKAKERLRGAQVKTEHEIPEFGVWRIVAEHEDWQTVVRERARAARAIIMVVNGKPNDGLAWEMQLLGTGELLAKTVILVAPDCAASAANAKAWAWISATTEGRVANATTDSASPVLACFQTASGEVTVVTSSRFERADYLMALRAFFRR